MSANSSTIARGDNRPKTPGLVGLLTAAVMLVVIVPLALRFSQAPAETIAEFAPQVSQEIKKAPNDQAAINGQGKGAGLAGATPTPTPSPTPAASGSGAGGGPANVVSSPSELQCVDGPGGPRQIADTQSPPCIPYWAGDNGGSNGAHGVDGSTIGVAFWVETGSSQKALENDLINFFNNHFQFYGRKLKLIEETPKGGCSTAPSGNDGQRQEADRLYAAGAFITLDSYYNAGACFVDESARKGMVTIDSYPYFTESQMAAYAPYMWSYYASADKEFSDTGAYICARMAGQPASHANGENIATTPPQPMNTSKRKFGAVVQYDATTPVSMSLQPLRDALGRCGEQLADVDMEPLVNNNGSYPDGTNPQKFQEVMAKFQSEGITSVIVVGQPFIEQFFSAGADQQQYHPEWLFDSTMWSNDWDPILRLFWPNADQRASQLFGLSWGPRQVAYASSPAQWAVWDTDPSFTFPTSSTANATSMVRLSQAYHELLVAAAGIQMAGPKLTAQTFSDGLMRTQFPNPPSWQQEGTVGFPGVHYFTQDFVEWWWGESTPSVYTDEGAFSICYEAHGARRTAQTIQRGPDDYFTSACDNGSRPP
jgi:hypothetical protein